jgi:putative hydrolase of the HAD superfamily
VIRAVTFDAVGTLIAPRERVGTTYARVARRHGVDAAPATVERRFRQALAAAPPLAFPDVPPSGISRCERAWWRSVVGRALGLADDAAALEPCTTELFDHFAKAEAWSVYPDVVPAFGALFRAERRIGVVSNFDGRLPALLHVLGLAPSLSAIVWSSRVGAAKPDRHIFEAAAADLRVPMSSMLHVGDDPRADVQGARAAGARSLLLRRGTPSRRGSATDLSVVVAAIGGPERRTRRPETRRRV